MPRLTKKQKAEIESAVEEGEKPPRKKMMGSQFHMTLSSNIRLKNASVVERIEAVQTFVASLESLFSDVDEVKSMIELREPGVNMSRVKFMSVLAGVEYSTKSGMHAHCIMDMYHLTRVRLDFKNIRALLAKKFPYKIYMNARWVRDGGSRAKAYATKTIGGVDYNVPDDIKDLMTDGFNFKTDFHISDRFKFDDDEE